MRLPAILGLAVAFIALSSTHLIGGHLVGDEIYKWVDSDGVIHFANRRSPQSPKESNPRKVRAGKGGGGVSAQTAAKPEAAQGHVRDRIKQLEDEVERLQGGAQPVR